MNRQQAKFSPAFAGGARLLHGLSSAIWGRSQTLINDKTKQKHANYQTNKIIVKLKFSIKLL